MRILFVITSLTSLGGTERVAITLANALSKKHDIHLASKTIGPTSYSLCPDVKDHRCSSNIFLFRKDLSRLINKINPDLVVIHTMSKLTPFLLLTGLKAKKIWTYEHTSYQFHNSFYKFLRQKFYKKADRILVLTESQKEIFQNMCEEVSVIKNPSPFKINTSQYNPYNKNIISIGRLNYFKGYDLLLNAWSEIHKKNPGWSLSIYGEGEELTKLKNQAKRLGLSSNIFKGLATNVVDVYDRSSFYVMSSRFEGLPMVLIEAQSRGLPIVSFDCPSGPNEIINHTKNGYLVTPESYKELASRMQDLISDQELRISMHKHSLLSAKRFDLESIIEQWDLLLNDLG